MKAELRARPHALLPGSIVVEIWWGDAFIGEITGADSPGVRVISKYEKVPRDVAPLILQVDIKL